jgi:hypothetical protein
MGKSFGVGIKMTTAQIEYCLKQLKEHQDAIKFHQIACGKIKRKLRKLRKPYVEG